MYTPREVEKQGFVEQSPDSILLFFLSSSFNSTSFSSSSFCPSSVSIDASSSSASHSPTILLLHLLYTFCQVSLNGALKQLIKLSYPVPSPAAFFTTSLYYSSLPILIFSAFLISLYLFCRVSFREWTF